MLKWVGAVFIVVSCGSVGFRIAAEAIREQRLLYQLSRVLALLERELRYQLTPLPELITTAAEGSSGVLRELLSLLAANLRCGTFPDAASSMDCAISESSIPFISVKEILRQIGVSLGRFDLDGQLQELRVSRLHCEELQRCQQEGLQQRLKSCRILGLCVGAALVILLV